MSKFIEWLDGCLFLIFCYDWVELLLFGVGDLLCNYDIWLGVERIDVGGLLGFGYRVLLCCCSLFVLVYF